LAGCIPKAVLQKGKDFGDQFKMLAVSKDDLESYEEYTLLEVPIKKGEGPLKGTEVTGLCPK
jgi:hypothetical protein